MTAQLVITVIMAESAWLVAMLVRPAPRVRVDAFTAGDA